MRTKAKEVADKIAMDAMLRQGNSADTIEAALNEVADRYKLDLAKMSARIKVLERMDKEASTYVESTICMRTNFTGDKPYRGWKGLGLALTEALDERDRLRLENAKLKKKIEATTATTLFTENS